jgi:membrane-associated protease RseP (regulator of RpoE activity)
MFWVMGLILGARGATGENAGAILIMWVGVVFVSILVHEFGHALTMRYHGESPRVVLYMMGGLAIADSAGWGLQKSSRTPREQIIISAAGPIAGFLLAGLVVATIHAAGGRVFFDFGNVLPDWTISLPSGSSILVYHLVHDLLWVNIFWGLINLLPIYPLDGGQITRELFLLQDPWRGIVRSLWLSTIAGAAVAVMGALFLGSILMALLFGSLAMSSYLALQQHGGGYGGGRPW